MGRVVWDVCPRDEHFIRYWIEREIDWWLHEYAGPKGPDLERFVAKAKSVLGWCLYDSETKRLVSFPTVGEWDEKGQDVHGYVHALAESLDSQQPEGHVLYHGKRVYAQVGVCHG